MTISADNFWIELDRLLGAPRPTAAQMEALVDRYGRVWPDIHARAIKSPDHFKSLTRALAADVLGVAVPFFFEGAAGGRYV